MKPYYVSTCTSTSKRRTVPSVIQVSIVIRAHEGGKICFVLLHIPVVDVLLT